MKHEATAHVKAMRREAIASAEAVIHGLTCERCGLWSDARMVLLVCEWTEEEFLQEVLVHLALAP